MLGRGLGRLPRFRPNTVAYTELSNIRATMVRNGACAKYELAPGTQPEVERLRVSMVQIVYSCDDTYASEGGCRIQTLV